MPRKPALKEPEPKVNSIVGGVNGEQRDVALSAMIFDPVMFRSAAEARHVEGRWVLLKFQGNRDFLPVLHPRLDGTFAVLAFRRA